MNKNNAFNFLIVSVILSLTACNYINLGHLSPCSLSVSEGFINPIGFYDAQPSFSWKLPVDPGIKSQTAYRIVVASKANLLPLKADLWESGKVESDQSVWVGYQGKPLSSRQEVFWQIMFWDQDGRPSEWSDVAHFELGLLDNMDWQGQWISLPTEENPEQDSYGTIRFKPEYMRRDFTIDGVVSKARLYITSMGVFQAELNGAKVGHDVLVPGFTPYSKRLETLTYDVTDQLNSYENTIGILLGEGWYSGRLGWAENMWLQKPMPKVLCQLEITYSNGKTDTIVTNSEWKGTRLGPIRFSGIYDGEVYDAHMEMPLWSSPGYNDETWLAVINEPIEAEPVISPKRHSAVKTMLHLSPVAISTRSKGTAIFDMGQNMVGVAKVKIPVKKDQKITIRFAEMLQKDGSMYTENYRSAKSTDYYIPATDGLVDWQPTFTFHGFRYVELSGYDESVVPDTSWVTGMVQYSDFRKNGIFTTSNAKLNQLQQNIEWGMRGNFVDIPTDCPQRDERLGWTGDAQVFAPTSIFIGDVHAFWMGWLQSMREDQDDEGGIPFVVPNIMGKTFSSGWADAATVIPWEIYFRTGDKGVLKENFNMMRNLVGYYKSKANNNLVRVNTFGDWLQPFPIEPGNQRGDTPKDLIGTAYYAHSIELTLNAAKVLKKDQEVLALSTLLNNVRRAFQKEYLDPNGRLTTEIESQTGYLMALAFNLVSDELKEKVLLNLLEQIKKADYHLRTGFLGTPLLAKVLDETGHTDIMLSILFQETYPSWFYSINQGATTMWERWNSYSHQDGFGSASMNSFNHYAYGAIGQWMYERIAGIRPVEPGYKRIMVEPLFESELKSAAAEYNSIYGEIASEWHKDDDEIALNITIPPNTSALVKLPKLKASEVTVNGMPLIDELKNTIEETADGLEIEIIPGNYRFRFPTR